MSDAFPILDLASQAPVVQRLLAGRSDVEKVAWLASRGSLSLVEGGVSDTRPVYFFESMLGLRCVFFINRDRFVFFGDNTTYTVAD